jgi:hypothetical protein
MHMKPIPPQEWPVMNLDGEYEDIEQVYELADRGDPYAQGFLHFLAQAEYRRALAEPENHCSLHDDPDDTPLRRTSLDPSDRVPWSLAP